MLGYGFILPPSHAPLFVICREIPFSPVLTREQSAAGAARLRGLTAAVQPIRIVPVKRWLVEIPVEAESGHGLRLLAAAFHEHRRSLPGPVGGVEAVPIDRVAYTFEAEQESRPRREAARICGCSPADIEVTPIAEDADI